jgi:hypothetical protein
VVNLIEGTLILALLLSMLAAVFIDVCACCREAYLDALWEEDE